MELALVIILSLLIGALCSGIVVYVLQSRRQREMSEKLIVSEANLKLAETNAAMVKENCESRIAELKAQAERDQKNNDEKFKITLDAAREQMKNQFEQETARRAEQLKKDNAERMQTVVEPLQKELEGLRKLVAETKEKSDKSTSALEESIKMVLMHDKERDKTTQNLAEALKNRGKVHGDWGEHVLTDILRDSGLRENIEYKVQTNVKSEEGADLRPDVIVNAPDGASIIIDSKVSLTAYTNYVGAETDDERAVALKENYDSIWRHVMELAQKNYSKVVERAVPYVLMFVPNEGSYLLALNKDQELLQKAYKKNVIIINPTNLMLTLQLILLTWQNTRQEENCSKILAEAEAIYEKYKVFVDNYIKLGSQIKTAESTYNAGLGQISEGKGNMSRRIDNLRNLGIKTAKRISEAVLPYSIEKESEDEN